MENASKALIMAGGMLLAILLVSLLIYAWSLYSEYQTSKVALIEIEDTAKFNSQFEGYDREDVLGYELLSLLNQIVDYNERRTTQSINKGNDKYDPIKIEINLVSVDYRKNFTYNDSEIYLIENDLYSDDELTAIKEKNGIYTRTSFKQTIDNKLPDYKDTLGVDKNTLEGMAKNIRTIFKTESEIEHTRKEDETAEDVKKTMILAFNSYIKKYPLEFKDADYKKLVLKENNGKKRPMDINTVNGINMYEVLCKYYEYMQFKRGIFRCAGLQYDTNGTGRVKEIKFDFTGKIK